MTIGSSSAAVSAISSGGGLTSSIAVSVLASSFSAEKAQITTLFSSIGLGANVNSLA